MTTHKRSKNIFFIVVYIYKTQGRIFFKKHASSVVHSQVLHVCKGVLMKFTSTAEE